MYTELANFSLHCRNCATERHNRPDPDFMDILSDVDWSKKNVRGAFILLHGCKTLFLFHSNIIAHGPDSFVLVDSPEDPKKVIKIYTNATFEKILKYKEETDEFARQKDGEIVNCGGKKFLIKVNPILEVMPLSKDGCVATLSSYIAGENEYDRYMEKIKLYSEKNPKDPYFENADFISYEEIMKNIVETYIDPRNFKVDEEKNVITITDIKSNVINCS